MKVIDKDFVMCLLKIVDSNGCWIYKGAIHHTGYGIICTSAFGRRRNIKLNRLVCYVFHGLDINDPKQFACHKNICKSRACFNPEHLYKGDNSSNQLDSVANGTHHEAKKSTCIRGHFKDGNYCKQCAALKARERREFKHLRRRSYGKRS